MEGVHKKGRLPEGEIAALADDSIELEFSGLIIDAGFNIGGATRHEGLLRGSWVAPV